MKLQQTKQQRIKAIVHFVQAFLIFVAGCLTLAVMTKSGGFGGQTGFYFALCFFTVPALIYQVMVPIWSRAWRLNSVWAFGAIDIAFAILWFAASIAVAVWNANGIAKGNNDESKDDSQKHTRRAQTSNKAGTCAAFGYGSESKCKVSKATVGFGIIIFFLFGFTSFLSIRAIREYRRTGMVPNSTVKNLGDAESLDEPSSSKDVWSTNTDELDHSSDDDQLAFAQGAQRDDKEGLLNRRSFDTTIPTGGMHPGRKMRYEPPESLAPTMYDESLAPSALSPTGLPTSPNGRVQFPEANYSALR